MKLKETIKLRENPFPSPFSVKAEMLVEYFAHYGFKFEILDEGTIMLHDFYIPERFVKVKKLIDEKGLDLKIYHSIYPKYEEKDYKENPLWVILFSDIFINGIDFNITCKVCNKKRVLIDLSQKVPIVKSKKPIVSVNGQFTIVKNELKVKMETELSGAHFEFFDEQGEYFYLMARSKLGNLINTPDDFLEYGGTCPECNFPIFKMFYAPKKYSKLNWNGDDIVNSEFQVGKILFTGAAFKLLKKVDRTATRDGVVILE